ncbi:hypothetical protein KI688_003391 [Linnemannia hyalina]|uniref:Uncharacterized protein n=1 Tax=Linnemannia hyalina TaxID=64524 RepID=A0A9P7XPE0_9FUNG|nr:hypothetical protein KI688_003391 [Linnemannia hyalina]
MISSYLDLPATSSTVESTAQSQLSSPPSIEPTDWPVGMTVWLYTPPRTTGDIVSKFRKCWIGPCRIAAIRSIDIRDLIDPQQCRQLWIHVSRLKPFYDRQSTTPEPSVVPAVDPASVPLPEPIRINPVITSRCL